jgi:ankyrin repeat protein
MLGKNTILALVFTVLALRAPFAFSIDIFSLAETGSSDQVAKAFSNSNLARVTDSDGMTALMHAAARNSDGKVIDTLLDLGSEINAVDKYGMTALMYAAANNDHLQVLEALLDRKPDLLLTTPSGDNALHLAAENAANPAIIRELLKHGFGVDAPISAGAFKTMTPLMLAAWRNPHPAVVAALIEDGADIRKVDSTGRTALFFAAWHNSNERVTEELIERGSEEEARDSYGMTPLVICAWRGKNVGSLLALLKAGADVNVVDITGHTALEYCRMNESFSGTQAVEFLEKETTKVESTQPPTVLFFFPFRTDFERPIEPFDFPQAEYVCSYPEFLAELFRSIKTIEVRDYAYLFSKDATTGQMGYSNWNIEDLQKAVKMNGGRLEGYGVTGFIRISASSISQIGVTTFDL